jgi:transcriptional regulator GlxA family with amidase domain
MLKNLFSQLIIELFRTLHDQVTIQSNSPITGQSEVLQIKSTIIFMQQNIDQPYDVQFFADKNCMSSSHFRRLFKQVVGMPPGKFFSEMKINHAKLLLNSFYSVNEVADKVGFNSVEHFSKTFKKSVGISPGHYRTFIHK